MNYVLIKILIIFFKYNNLNNNLIFFIFSYLALKKISLAACQNALLTNFCEVANISVSVSVFYNYIMFLMRKIIHKIKIEFKNCNNFILFNNNK